MSGKLKEGLSRLVIGLALVGLEVSAFVSGGTWWTAFAIAIGLGVYLEILVRTNTTITQYGYARHCGVLALTAIVGPITLIQLRETRQGSALIILIWVMVTVFDTFSYIVGSVASRKTGGHKIAPKESPNKTWEGFFGGYIASLAAAIVTFSVLDQHYVTLDIGWTLLMVPWLPLVAYFGDLNESMAKRRLLVGNTNRVGDPNDPRSIKDFSNVLGSHGGIADRFDAMLAVYSTVGMAWLLSI